MKIITLDCARLFDREAAHAYLAEALNFPDYYGKNLDALYDCLTQLRDCTLVLEGAETLRQAGGYGAKILQTIKDAARDDPGLTVELQDMKMRLLFTMDGHDYDPHGTVFSRPSARAIILQNGRTAMVHSRQYDYYKFPGGGIEPGESRTDALIREVREETGLVVLPESIKPYGFVHRIERGDTEDIFVQDNYYYFCQTLPEPLPPVLDDYEAQERHVLEYVPPDAAIAANRTKENDRDCKYKNLLEREARVLELLMAEGKFRL